MKKIMEIDKYEVPEITVVNLEIEDSVCLADSVDSDSDPFGSGGSV